MSDPRPFQPGRSRWIPWAFLGGMLLVVAVNAGMVFAAISTFTGVTVGKAYDKGRAYNHVLEEARRQDALGWTGTVRLEGGALRVTVTDRAGLPVAGRIDGVLRRPIEGTELPLELAATAPGHWAAPVELHPGQWDARLTLTDSAGHRFDLRQRVIAP